MSWLLLAVALQAGVTAATPLQAPATPVTNTCPQKGPDWRRLAMRPEDYLSAYPAEALRRRLNGSAVLDCLVTSVQRPAQCTVVKETPEGAGFGAAAVKLSRYYRFKPPCGGEAGHVSLPIDFRLPQ